MLNKKMIASVQNLVFIIGGPYGFDESIYQRANEKLSLSRMTFSHQMVRLFFAEQVYRAFTILKGEPYHHQ
jgi:23S rRNA (pseudouridine1915-N3)-methyltransferase